MMWKSRVVTLYHRLCMIRDLLLNYFNDIITLVIISTIYYFYLIMLLIIV